MSESPENAAPPAGGPAGGRRPARPVRASAPRRPAPRMPRAAAAAPRRAAAGRGFGSHPALRLALLGFGLLLVAALFADLRGALSRGAADRARTAALDRPEALVLGIEDRRYADPAGRFALTTPAAWFSDGPSPEGEYDARMQGPRNVEIRIVVNELPHDRFDLLLASIRGQEDQLEVPMNIRRIEFRGRPAVERRARLTHLRLYMLDFLDGRVAHHLQASLPNAEFDALLPVVRDILGTYEAPAGRGAPADGEGAAAPSDGKPGPAVEVHR